VPRAWRKVCVFALSPSLSLDMLWPRCGNIEIWFRLVGGFGLLLWFIVERQRFFFSPYKYLDLLRSGYKKIEIVGFKRSLCSCCCWCILLLCYIFPCPLVALQRWSFNMLMCSYVFHVMWCYCYRSTSVFVVCNMFGANACPHVIEILLFLSLRECLWLFFLIWVVAHSF
jgi:hypothetical protein